MSHASYSSHSASVVTEDEGDWEDYVKGDTTPVHIGDSFSDGRYTFQPFGWRRMTSASRDLFPRPLLNLSNPRMNRPVALKVVKYVPRYTKTALDEIHCLVNSSTPPFPPSPTQPNALTLSLSPQPIMCHLHFRHKA
jgi:serine/threonine-protein kinase SRPK3